MIQERRDENNVEYMGNEEIDDSLLINRLSLNERQILEHESSNKDENSGNETANGIPTSPSSNEELQDPILIETEGRGSEEAWLSYKSLVNSNQLDKLDIKDFNRVLGLLKKSISSHPESHGRMLTILEDMQSVAKVEPDESTYNILMSMCLERKDFKGIKHYFKAMQQQNINPNTVTYNIIITAVVKLGKPGNAFALYDEMVKKGIERNHRTYTVLLQACAKKQSISRAKLLYEAMLKEGIKPDVVVYNARINVIARNARNIKELRPAFDIVEEMRQNHVNLTTSTYHILIKSLMEMNERTESLQLFNQMEYDQCLPDALILEGIGITGLQALIKMRDTYNMTPTTEDYNTFMNQALNESKFNDANEILKLMLKCGFKPSVSTYSIIINAHIRNGDVVRAMQLYEAMKRDNIQADSYIFSSLIVGHIAQGDVGRAFELYGDMLNSNIELNTLTINRMVDTASKLDDVSIVQKVFERLLNLTNPGKIAFEMVIWRIAQVGDRVKVDEYLSLMARRDHNINDETFRSIITGSCKGKHLREARFWYKRMIDLGLRPNHMLLSSLLKCHAESKDVEMTYVLWDDFHYFSILPDDEDIMFILLVCRETKSWQMENRVLEQLKELGYNVDTYKSEIESVKLDQSREITRGAIETWIKTRKPSDFGQKNRELKDAQVKLQKWAKNVGLKNELRLDKSAKNRIAQWLPYRKIEAMSREKKKPIE
ncbi:5389_t:CDS:1 [Acaulospora morrowiae]|uniref:5389_t:CDS:1 n=1 Tax=Acaulospora morrowiae TaxID=94023 RepID=A0A9N8VGF5_9GLOM|nr:5389_t:CDS:1 [Acaulospora morrowiae]